MLASAFPGRVQETRGTTRPNLSSNGVVAQRRPGPLGASARQAGRTVKGRRGATNASRGPTRLNPSASMASTSPSRRLTRPSASTTSRPPAPATRRGLPALVLRRLTTSPLPTPSTSRVHLLDRFLPTARRRRNPGERRSAGSEGRGGVGEGRAEPSDGDDVGRDESVARVLGLDGTVLLPPSPAPVAVEERRGSLSGGPPGC